MPHASRRSTEANHDSVVAGACFLARRVVRDSSNVERSCRSRRDQPARQTPKQEEAADAAAVCAYLCLRCASVGPLFAAAEGVKSASDVAGGDRQKSKEFFLRSELSQGTRGTSSKIQSSSGVSSVLFSSSSTYHQREIASP